jgi:hypothetical protein
MHRVWSVLWLIVQVVFAVLAIYWCGWVAYAGPFS